MAAKRERSNSLRESARGLPPQLVRHQVVKKGVVLGSLLKEYKYRVCML